MKGVLAFCVALIFMVVFVSAEEHSHDEGTRDSTSSASDLHTHAPNESVFLILVNDIQKPRPALRSGETSSNPNAETDTISQDSGKEKELNEKLPLVELIKLKTAAKNAGLTESKSNRVARAAETLNMTYNDVAELRKILNNPATSAEHADKVRRALEDAAIEQEVNDKEEKAGIAKRDTIGIQPILNSFNPQKVDKETLKRVLEAAKLSGLNATETLNFLKALHASNLDSDNLKKLEASIKEHGPSAVDLNKLAQHLHDKTKRDTDEGREGADWLFDKNQDQSNDSGASRQARRAGAAAGHGGHHAVNAGGGGQQQSSHDEFEEDNSADFPDPDEDPEPEKRSIDDNTITKSKVRINPNNQVDATLFHAKRLCGFSPKVDPSRLSNASPGQFPWSVAILSSENAFLCAGTLISESLVLTSASCIIKYKQQNSNHALQALLGAWSLPDSHNKYLPELQVFVRAAILHPNYVLDKVETQSHNVGLLQLYENVDFDLYPHIFPICIIGPQFDAFAATTDCRVLGWPEMPHMEIWRSSSFLAWGDVKIGGNDHECGVPADMSCAIGHACVANEGSPVICQASSQRYYQLGVSTSDVNCDRAATTSIPIVNLLKNYDFIEKYLRTG